MQQVFEKFLQEVAITAEARWELGEIEVEEGNTSGLSAREHFLIHHSQGCALGYQTNGLSARKRGNPVFRAGVGSCRNECQRRIGGSLTSKMIEGLLRRAESPPV